MNFTALIVTYNRLSKLKESISSTLDAGFNQIVVIDNASNDGTREWLQGLNNDKIHTVFLDKNTGGAGGFYHGMNVIIEKIETDWIFVYDDDAFPDRNILNAFERLDSGFDVYCSKVVDRKNEPCTMNIPFVKFPVGITENIQYGFMKKRFVADVNVPQEVSSFSFVGAILSKEFIKRNISNMFPELFLYFDDLYYSFLAHSQGERFYYSPDLIFTHDVPPQGRGVMPEWKVYYLLRNTFLSRLYLQKNATFGVVFISLRVIKHIINVVYQQNKILYLNYAFKGIKHGWKNITGNKHNSSK